MIFTRAITLSYLGVASRDQTVPWSREPFRTCWYLGNLYMKELSSHQIEPGIVFSSH